MKPPCVPACREVGGKREHRLRVFTELMFGHKANKPAPGTNDYNRTCMPYPFSGELSAAEAACDFKIAIDGFKKTAHYSMGEPRDTGGRTCPPPRGQGSCALTAGKSPGRDFTDEESAVTKSLGS